MKYSGFIRTVNFKINFNIYIYTYNKRVTSILDIERKYKNKN